MYGVNVRFIIFGVKNEFYMQTRPRWNYTLIINDYWMKTSMFCGIIQIAHKNSFSRLMDFSPDWVYWACMSVLIFIGKFSGQICNYFLPDAIRAKWCWQQISGISIDFPIKNFRVLNMNLHVYNCSIKRIHTFPNVPFS